MDLHGSFHVYDTTLRDGAQQEGLNLSVADKLTIARQLDGLGVGYIEGGWPGANPKDTEFFRRARDVAHAQAVELLGDGQLVGDGEVEALLLGAVAQGGVVDVERAVQVHRSSLGSGVSG